MLHSLSYLNNKGKSPRIIWLDLTITKDEESLWEIKYDFTFYKCSLGSLISHRCHCVGCWMDIGQYNRPTKVSAIKFLSNVTAAWHPGENTDKHDAPYQPTPSNWNSINKLSLNSEHSLHCTQHLIYVFVWSIVSYDNPDDWHSNIVASLCGAASRKTTSEWKGVSRDCWRQDSVG